MPTGYTADIEKGISFKEYATKCLRNFGATINLREEPWDTPITKETICGSGDMSHYNKELEDAKQKLERFNRLTEEQKRIDFENEKSEKINRYNGYIQEKLELKKKYLQMLEKVKLFQPPTDDHVALKNFMENQIHDSIEWDCKLNFYYEVIEKANNKTFEDYLREKEESLLEDIEFREKVIRDNTDRNDSRWEWIEKALKSIDEVGE